MMKFFFSAFVFLNIVFSVPASARTLEIDTARLLARIDACNELTHKKEKAAEFVRQHNMRAITNYPFELAHIFNSMLFIERIVEPNCRRGLLENTIEVLGYVSQNFPKYSLGIRNGVDLVKAKFMLAKEIDSRNHYTFEDADQALQKMATAADEGISLIAYAYIFIGKIDESIADAAYRRATEITLRAYNQNADANLLIPFASAQELLMQNASEHEKRTLESQLVRLWESDADGVFSLNLAKHYSKERHDDTAKAHLDRYFVKVRESFLFRYEKVLTRRSKIEAESQIESCVGEVRLIFEEGMYRMLSPQLKNRYDPEVLSRSVCAPPISLDKN